VFQYTLSTAWDISTASYASNSFSVASQDIVPNGLFFKSDGTKMYVAGNGNDNIYQYTLSTAYDVSTASYDSVSIDISGQTSGPTGLVFHPDGGYFYLTGVGSVFKYSLSTAWDLSTATYSSVTADLTGTQDTSTYNLAFKSDGTKMYVVSGNADTIYQYSTALSTRTLDQSTGSVFEITPTSDIQIGLSNPAASGTVSAATLLLDGAGTVAGQETVSSGVEFKTDGTKMYVVGSTGDDVNEYSLSTAWDISTASYTTNFSVSAQHTTPQDIAFKTDGTEMYIVGSSADIVSQYTLTTAWDVSTASYVRQFSTSGQETIPQGLTFKPDGTMMFVSGLGADAVHAYNLSTAWDISSASLSRTESVSAQTTSPASVLFDTSGLKMFVLGRTENTVYEYNFTVAWNLSTISYSGTSFVLSDLTNPSGFSFKTGGTEMYVVDYDFDAVYQYSTATPATITYDSTIEFAGGTAPTSPAIGDTDILTFSTRDGGTTYQSVQAVDGAK
jgi:sugar lactone lactonase YvrE